MNKILTQHQEEYYMRQKLPSRHQTYTPELQVRLDEARKKKSVSQALDACLDYISSNGGLSGVRSETYHWLREKRRDSTI